MSLEALLDYALTALAAVLGWFVKMGHDAHKDLEREVDMCVRKDDFKEALHEIRDQHREMFKQLDRQNDKLDDIRSAVAGKVDRSELLEQRAQQL